MGDNGITVWCDGFQFDAEGLDVGVHSAFSAHFRRVPSHVHQFFA